MLITCQCGTNCWTNNCPASCPGGCPEGCPEGCPRTLPRFMLQTPPPARILPSEWFPSGFERVPSGFQVVSERFPSSFGVFQTCPKSCPGVCPGFLGPQSCPEGCPRVCPGVCHGLLGPQSCPEGWFVPGFSGPQSCPECCPEICSGSCPRRFCALKAVRRVPGVCPGVVRGFKPVWTQNVKTGVYAEPPLSKHAGSVAGVR